jgi:hypothetical protein
VVWLEEELKEYWFHSNQPSFRSRTTESNIVPTLRRLHFLLHHFRKGFVEYQLEEEKEGSMRYNH